MGIQIQHPERLVMPWSLSISILALAYLGDVSAIVEVSTIEKEIEVQGQPYNCIFNLEHDDEFSILYTEYSNVTCSPISPEQEIVRYMELEDDEGHFFMVDFQMSPDKIIEGEYEALTPWEEFEAYEIEEIEDNKRHPCGARDQRISGNRTFLDTNRGAHDAEMPTWPNGIVPYVFDYSFTKSDRLVFAKAVHQIEEKTCIKFRPKKSEKYWLQVRRECDCEKGSCFGGGWADYLGAGSPARLSIGKMCMSPESSSDVGLTAHEIMHNLGIGHTQTRPDRDNYITVNFENITPDGKFQYQKCHGCKIHGTPYDCSSIMHYSDYDFQDGGPTMSPKNEKTCDSLSLPHDHIMDSDVQLMKAIYPCQDTKAVDGAWAFWSAWSSCKEGSKQRFRLCNNPKPSGGGKKCPGKNKERQTCATKIGDNCPADKTNTKGRTGVVEKDPEDEYTYSWSECATKCYHHATCQYWTWYKPTADPPNSYRCVFMEGYSTEVSDENAVSGHYSCPEEKLCKEDNVNSQGRVQAEKMNTDTWAECAAECKKRDSCTYWTWHHEGAGMYYTRCILMKAYANKVADSNAISGSKDC